MQHWKWRGIPVAEVLRIPAVRLWQNGHEVILFAVDGKQVHDFAAVSRIHRDDSAELAG